MVATTTEEETIDSTLNVKRFWPNRNERNDRAAVALGDNIFVTVGDNIFCCAIGILIRRLLLFVSSALSGADPAPAKSLSTDNNVDLNRKIRVKNKGEM